MLKKRKKERKTGEKNDLPDSENCKPQVYEVQPLQVIVTGFSSQGAIKSFIILDKQKI